MPDSQTYTVEEKDGVYTITVHGASDTTVWTLVDATAKAPASFSKANGVCVVTTRDRSLCAELCQILNSKGYGGNSLSL